MRVLDPRSGATWALPVQRHRGEWKYPPDGEAGGLPEKVLDELFKWLLEFRGMSAVPPGKSSRG